MICKLLVFRHSETFDNSRGVFSGWRDSELTLKGLSQAREISEQLKPYQIDYAFTSYLKRARKTLEIVLQGRTQVPVFIDDRLIERCYGLLQGKNKRKMRVEDPDWYARIHRGYGFVPPEGESFEMVEKRVIPFLNELTEWLKQNPGNVAISCHNNSIRPLRKRLENLSLTQMCKLKNPQDKALIYNLDLGTKRVLQEKTLQSKAMWRKVLISKAIRLATDKRNSLKTYYS
jgi:2,3-bisphosphoglycerate-dependent phosphoglycerate mutase